MKLNCQELNTIFQNYPDIETDYSIISEESGNILVGFDKFVAEHQIGLIVLNTHKRNLFAQLFNPSIAKRWCFIPMFSYLFSILKSLLNPNNVFIVN